MATNIFFKSAEHKQRFLTVMQQTGKIYSGKLDPEYGAALYILTADLDIWQEVSGYVSRRGMDIEAILEEVDLSGGYSVLVMLAGNLFNSQTHLDAIELMRLDDSNFTVALTALQVRRASLPVSELASEAELYNLEMDARNRITVENRDKPWLPLHDGE
ncbi:MAG: hypothetical protein ACJ788_12175 [Ktedonobacteraceae bacterium]